MWCQHRPQPADRGAHARVGAQFLPQFRDVGVAEQVALAEHVGAELGHHLPGEGVEHLPDEDVPCLVVRPPRAPGALARHRAGLPADQERIALDRYLQPVVGHLLPVTHGRRDDARHPQAALDHGSFRRLGRSGRDARVQASHGGQQHAGLAQRRQYLPDVAQEGGVRADDEYAALLQQPTVGVEQEGGAVQGDGRLAGTGAALHDEDAGQGGPDDVVLLSLDGLDDVTHPPGTAGTHGGQQGRLAGESLMAGRISRCEVQDLVVEADHLPVPGLDVPPQQHVLGRDGGGQVEGPRRCRAPVHQQLLVVLGITVNSEAADVAAIPVTKVEPAEAKPVLRSVELRKLLAVHGAEHFALGPGLMRPAGLPQHAG